MTEQANPFRKAEQLKPILHSANDMIGSNARASIAELYGVPTGDPDILQSRIKQTRRLILDVQRELKKLTDIDFDLYLSWIPKALVIFRPISNFDAAWPGERLSEQELVRLDFCIHALKKHFTEEHIAEEKLQEIREATEQLKSDILEAGFEHDLEEALVDAFQALLTAIDEYSLRGTVRLKEGLSIAVGTVAINFGLFGKPEDKSKWEKYGQRFTKVVRGLWTLIQFAIKNKAELQEGWTAVQGLIEGSPQPPADNQ